MKKLFIVVVALALPLSFVGAQSDTWSDRVVCTSLKNNLRYGSSDRFTNGEVSALQGLLQAKGYLNAPRSGFFGSLTLTAAKKYQAIAGLPVTGYVGPLTRAKIKAETCSAATPPTISATNRPNPGAFPQPPGAATPPAPVPVPVPVPSTPSPSTATFPLTNAFTWGVNAHPLYESHRNISAIEHLDAVKGLGMTSLRVDVYDATPTTLARLDTYVAEGKKRGISIQPVLYLQMSSAETPEAIRARSYDLARALAQRYKNDIRVWGLSNEIDNYSLLQPCEIKDDGTVYPCSAAGPGGTEKSDYKKSRYEQGRAQILGMGEGIRSVDANAQRIVNFSTWHTGYIERIIADAVPFEIIGWHWYTENHADYTIENVNGVNLAQKLSGFGKPIWFTEFNKWQGSRGGESAQASYLKSFMETLTKLSTKYRIGGAFVYELYDNPSEPDFGLIKLTGARGAGAKKLAYEAVKEVIAGKAAPAPTNTTNTPPSGVSTNVQVLGTPPTLAAPTAVFTVNGGSTATLNSNDSFVYQWSSQNADRFSSKYSATCENGSAPSGVWVATEASGSSSGNATDAAGFGCTYTITYTATQSSSGKSDSKTVTVKINSSTSSIGTAPMRADPTAAFTINGKDSETLSLGSAFTYQWKAANADSYSSSYTATCSNGASFGGPWIASSAEGTESGYVSDPAGLGCTYKLTYTATQSGTGKVASKTITVDIKSNNASAQKSNQMASVATGVQSVVETAPSSSRTNGNTSFSYTFIQDLYRGQSGAEVTALQQALKAEGLFGADISGNFYDQTREAVMTFQLKYGISATGYVGTATRAVLNGLYSR